MQGVIHSVKGKQIIHVHAHARTQTQSTCLLVEEDSARVGSDLDFPSGAW